MLTHVESPHRSLHAFDIVRSKIDADRSAPSPHLLASLSKGASNDSPTALRARSSATAACMSFRASISRRSAGSSTAVVFLHLDDLIEFLHPPPPSVGRELLRARIFIADAHRADGKRFVVGVDGGDRSVELEIGDFYGQRF
jgi:hypothetical protein